MLLQPNYSEVNSTDLLAQLATQLATLSVAAGNVVAVPAGENDGSGDTFWLVCVFFFAQGRRPSVTAHGTLAVQRHRASL